MLSPLGPSGMDLIPYEAQANIFMENYVYPFILRIWRRHLRYLQFDLHFSPSHLPMPTSCGKALSPHLACQLMHLNLIPKENTAYKLQNLYHLLLSCFTIEPISAYCAPIL